MQTERKSIQQRARELQEQLFGGTGPGATTYPQPTQGLVAPLATPPEYAALWAQSEAFVVNTVTKVVPKWIDSFTLQPCNVTGAMVTGSPGCVTADSPSGWLSSEFQGSDIPKRDEAQKFCKEAVERIFKQLESWRAMLAPMALNWYPPYGALMPSYPLGIPNVPCMLTELGRTASHYLQADQIDLVVQRALDGEWAKFNQDPMLPPHQTQARKVCTSIAKQVSKYMTELCKTSMVHDVVAESPSPVAPMTPTGPIALPFNGRTVIKRGFVKVVESWRPEWGV